MKSLVLRGREMVAGKPPLICVPLIGATGDALRAELAAILPAEPDLIEWRADFFAALVDTAKVIEVAQELRRDAGNIPVIFTCRAAHEGGERHALSEIGAVGLYELICASGAVDVIDFEMSHAPERIVRLRAASQLRGVAMILSFHDFQATPDKALLLAKIAEAERLGANVAKIAVMPNSPADVETLLAATREASQSASIPLIAMSMGELGLRSRIEGWKYGSVLTFASGKGASAPGQIAIERLRAAIGCSDAAR